MSLGLEMVLRVTFNWTFMVRCPIHWCHFSKPLLGELLDFIYLSQKFARPLGYDTWLAVRDLWGTTLWPFTFWPFVQGRLYLIYFPIFKGPNETAPQMWLPIVTDPTCMWSWPRSSYSQLTLCRSIWEVRDRERHFTVSKFYSLLLFLTYPTVFQGRISYSVLHSLTFSP